MVTTNRVGRALCLCAGVLAILTATTAAVRAQAPAATRVDLATPATYSASPGGTVPVTLNWYRMPMASNYLQFMHLVGAGGQLWSVDDHWTMSASWASAAYTETRMITVPAAMPAGAYDIRVGLSGGSPWVDLPLLMGVGVTDPGGDRRYKVGTLSVSGPANVAPQITTAPVTSATVGLAYGYKVNAIDANGDALTYSLTTRPTGMTISATTGQIAWTPTAAQIGSRAVAVRVVDPGGLSATQSFTINVAAANVAPQITSTAVTSATVGLAYSYKVAATDANGDTLSYSLTLAPAGMVIGATSGQISWTPSSAQSGNQAVTVRVVDPGGLAATQSFTVSVSNINVAPQINSAPVTMATVGSPYSYRVIATDANGDVLSFSLTQAPAGMAIGAASGQITWTPTSAQTGNQAVTARVVDPGGLSASQSFAVAVGAAGPAPQIGNSWRIMPIGDSNTENLAASPGYQVITQALSAIGRNSAVFGYVNPNEPNIVTQVTSPQIGRSGWSTTDVISQIDGWIDQVIPDIVLLNIGVNDGYFPSDPAAQDAVVGRIGTIIDMIRARNQRTAVLVSNFERATDSMPTMYTKIQQMVAQKAAISTGIFFNVFFVPSLTGVSSSMYTSDGIHPNESGRLIIMNNWMGAVRSYVQTGTVPPPTVSTAPSTTRVDLATPSAYFALPGGRVNINLNWYRMPMSANLLQFMHLDLNGNMVASVDDHVTTSATWVQGVFSETRTITAPTALGTYDIRVGLSGGSPWVDFVLATGTGVLDETNSRRYKVGTLTVTNTPP